MESLVVYYSETGNTEKIANAIAEGLGTVAEKIDENDSEFIVIGTPVHGGRPVEKVTNFIKKTVAEKAAVFWTCFGDPGDTLKIMKKGLEKRNIDFLGELDIRVGEKEPTEEHIKKARDFGKSLLSDR